MYVASSHGHIKIVKILIEHGANINDNDNVSVVIILYALYYNIIIAVVIVIMWLVWMDSIIYFFI